MQSYQAVIHLSGDVGCASFPGWIATHAAKLGLAIGPIRSGPDSLAVPAQGVEEMVHALALGCSLGPATVLVHRMELLPQGQA